MGWLKSRKDFCVLSADLYILAPCRLFYQDDLQENHVDYLLFLAIIIAENGSKVSIYRYFETNQQTLNNIAMCYLLEGELSKAYKYLLQAKALNIDCIFEKLCIQSNLAIIEWKLGKKESAKQIALDIYNEYIFIFVKAIT